MSRELDAQVAEKVMGIYPIRVHRAEWIINERDWAVSGELCYTGPENLLCRLPHYSTDIAAAWQVVEKMVAKGWRVSVWSRGSAWLAQFEKDIDYCVEGATAPEAICRAALKAMEGR